MINEEIRVNAPITITTLNETLNVDTKARIISGLMDSGMLFNPPPFPNLLILPPSIPPGKRLLNSLLNTVPRIATPNTAPTAKIKVN